MNVAPFLAKWQVYLNCPYKQKDEAKAKGAQFDKEKKRWYIYGAKNLAEFSKWLPSDAVESPHASAVVCSPEKEDYSVSPPAEPAPALDPESNASAVTYLKVPYADKDDAKAMGARFDPDFKLWYTQGLHVAPFLARWQVYLNCPYKQKDEAKAKGAQFDKEKKRWYISGTKNLADFSRWLPSDAIRSPHASQKSIKTTSDAVCSPLKSDSVAVVSAPSSAAGTAPKAQSNSEAATKSKNFRLNLMSDVFDSSESVTRPSKKQKPSPPNDYECPILMELMSDPVICADGFSYERSAIEKWLRQHGTSPTTNEPLTNKKLLPNKTLKAAITAWKDNLKG